MPMRFPAPADAAAPLRLGETLLVNMQAAAPSSVT
jgi:hypothetical protein